MKYLRKFSASLVILAIFSIIILNESPKAFAEGESEFGTDEVQENQSSDTSQQGSIPESEAESSQDSGGTIDVEQTENKEPTENQQSNVEQEDNSEVLDLGEEREAESVGNPAEEAVKNYTLTKTVSGIEEKIGDYDTFFEVVTAMDINDNTSLYTVYVNRDVTISADEGFHGRSNNQIRLTSGKGGPYKLTRQGEKNYINVQTDASLTIDNITLDGNNDGECLFISNNGVVTIGKGATIQNFIDTSTYDGPAIYMTGGTLNILEGATIKDNNSNQQGGAIQAYNGTTVNISGGIFKNNTTSKDGGVLAAYGKLNITGGVFDSNSSGKIAGAIIIGSNATGKIEGATFRNNKASTAGAVYSSSPLTIRNSTFEKNEANWGGAIFTSKKLELENCNFSENISQKAGGSVYLSGADIKNTEFIGNKSGSQGGGIYLKSGEAKIENSTFSGNFSRSGGGGIFVNQDNSHPVSITNSTFTENTSYGFGGGIYLGLNSILDVKNSEFSKNAAAYGAGISTAGEVRNSKTARLSVDNTSFSENESLMGAGIYTSFPTTVNTCTFTKNIAQVHPQDEQSNPHLSGVGGAMEIADSKTEIKNSRFESNSAFGSGGAIGINGVNRDENNNIKGIKPNIKLEISENSKFIGNTCEVGQGGAIYTNPYEYKDPIDDENAYKNLTIDKTTIFNDNIAKAGLYDPPSNYEKFTNLQFHPDSDVKHKSLEVSSLLNNYDINYKNGKYLIIYDANGGQFADGTSVKQKRYSKDKQIKIMPAPTKEGYKFLYWKGSEYQPGDTYTVTENHTFTAQWEEDKPKNTNPELKVKDIEIKVGDDLDLKDLIVKASDKEDGDDLKDKVEIDGASFDNNKAGVYYVKYTLTDSKGSKVTKTAKITVKEKSKPGKPDGKPIIPDYKPEIPDDKKELDPKPKEEETPIEKEEEKPIEKEPENTPPVLEVKNGAIKVGEKFDPRTLITKAYDKEDGPNLVDLVIIDQGNFDNEVAGRYEIKFTLIDMAGSKVTKLAYVDVLAKAKKEKLRNSRENPKTGIEVGFGLYSTILLLSSSVYTGIRKKY
ncbi:right-handed parallel beta-helix repeat-containing protein [Anaerococcus murdochii]|uniref:Right-handed parallel beta-helix repeat-containing protein n=1 Tax=Anaerococcus murdochii TaxID=411577 RepID=A0ABS7SW24_9FIRM|nr:right-handed parallel beta-helix repeat-containing protein [Anaerococcus murdochii]MBZ2385739.1 right-handed parallel beta-helix repeat-containing protein [Anaerococcus murdochii]